VVLVGSVVGPVVGPVGSLDGPVVGSVVGSVVGASVGSVEAHAEGSAGGVAGAVTVGVATGLSATAGGGTDVVDVTALASAICDVLPAPVGREAVATTGTATNSGGDASTACFQRRTSLRYAIEWL